MILCVVHFFLKSELFKFCDSYVLIRLVDFAVLLQVDINHVYQITEFNL